MKVLDFSNCCQERQNNVTEFINDNNIEYKAVNGDAKKLIISDPDANKIEDNKSFEWYDFVITNCTYDVHFDDESNSNCKGWAIGFTECKDYINTYNGTDESYFEYYKGGTVSIYCNELAETVFETEIK